MFKATAVSYAKGAERLLGRDTDFLNDNPDMVPQFVNALFQSIEISLKEVGNSSGLTTENETTGGRGCLIGNGHDIEKLGCLLKDRLGTTFNRRVAQLLTTGIEDGTADVLNQMIFGRDFRPTRTSYMKRKLVYHAELEEGDMQVFSGAKPWVDAVKAVAANIDEAVALVKRWKDSGSGQSYEEWYIQETSVIYR